jgi:hypothetical protein
VLTGHVPYGIHLELGIVSPRYFTLLREPLARLFSHFNYVRSNPRHYLHHETIDRKLDFNSYVTNHLSPELCNGMVRQLSGLPTAWSANPDFEQLFEAAKANLDRMYAVGVMEDYSASLRLISSKLGWRQPISMYHNNRSLCSSYLGSIPSMIAEAVYRHNEYDVKLYNYARLRFEADTTNLPNHQVQSAVAWKGVLLTKLHRVLECFK